MVGWWDGGLVEWWDGGMVGWWHGGMVAWWDGGLAFNAIVTVCEALFLSLYCAMWAF